MSSMVFLDFHWIPLRFHWYFYFYDVSMGYLWEFHGASMISLWDYYGIPEGIL